MEPKGNKALLAHFAGLEDPRTREPPHRLDEILLVAVCGILSGADCRAGVALWGQAKLPLLRGSCRPGTARPRTTRPGGCSRCWTRRCPAPHHSLEGLGVRRAPRVGARPRRQDNAAVQVAGREGDCLLRLPWRSRHPPERCANPSLSFLNIGRDSGNPASEYGAIGG